MSSSIAHSRAKPLRERDCSLIGSPSARDHCRGHQTTFVFGGGTWPCHPERQGSAGLPSILERISAVLRLPSRSVRAWARTAAASDRTTAKRSTLITI